MTSPPPQSSRACRCSAANTGVPANTMRSDRGFVMVGSGAVALLFFQLLADAGAFQRRQVIDIELAAQVIVFLLDADREQAFRVQPEGVAVAVERAVPNMFCP